MNKRKKQECSVPDDASGHMGDFESFRQKFY